MISRFADLSSSSDNASKTGPQKAIGASSRSQISCCLFAFNARILYSIFYLSFTAFSSLHRYRARVQRSRARLSEGIELN